MSYSPTGNLDPFSDKEFSFAVKSFQNKERLFFFPLTKLKVWVESTLVVVAQLCPTL